MVHKFRQKRKKLIKMTWALISNFVLGTSRLNQLGQCIDGFIFGWKWNHILYLKFCNALYGFKFRYSEKGNTISIKEYIFLYVWCYEFVPQVQEELDGVAGKKAMPQYADRDKTPYTEAVIHEIQRLGDIASLRWERV